VLGADLGTDFDPIPGLGGDEPGVVWATGAFAGVAPPVLRSDFPPRRVADCPGSPRFRPFNCRF